MSVRAKMIVAAVTAQETGASLVRLECQYDDTIPEDQRFYDATPMGHLEMLVNNPTAIEQLQEGQAFYVDLLPVPAEGVRGVELGSGVAGAPTENPGEPQDTVESAEAHQARRDEAERQRAAFPQQTVIVRAQPGSDKLGLVVQRFGGGYECEELAPRHARELTLEGGDAVHVVPLHGRDAEEFMRITGTEPADAAPE